jgi:hypothetical protein
MSLQSTARKFVDLCNQGKNFDVMRTMYAPDIVSVEGDGKETKGQEPVIHKSEVWQADNNIHGEKVRGPFFNGDDQEVGLYTVGKADKITREQFYYDGEH